MADPEKRQRERHSEKENTEDSDDEFVGPMPVESNSPKAKKRKGK